MRGRSAVWTGSRIGWKASARAASLIWHLVRLLWRLARWAGDDRGRAGGFVTRTALRHRTETLLLAALALLAAWGAIAATGALELLLAIACLALCLGAWGSWQVAGRYSVGAASERAVAKRLRLLERSGWFCSTTSRGLARATSTISPRGPAVPSRSRPRPSATARPTCARPSTTRAGPKPACAYRSRRSCASPAAATLPMRTMASSSAGPPSWLRSSPASRGRPPTRGISPAA